MEIRKVLGYEDCLVSPDGGVYRADGSARKIYTNSGGYKRTSVLDLKTGKRQTVGVHRLVAMAYCARPNPVRNSVNHRDSDTGNNHYSNLEWVTVYENNIHHELSLDDRLYDKLYIKKDGKPFAGAKNLRDAEEKTGVPALTVWDCVKDCLSVDGYEFIYLDRNEKTPKLLRPLALDRRNGHVGCGIKIKDIDTGEVSVFSSFTEVSKFVGVYRSHLHKVLNSPDKAKIVARKYLIAYSDAEFPEMTAEQVALAKRYGKPMDVYARNLETGVSIVYKSAASFVKEFGLPRISVTRELKKNRLRVISGWVFAYLSRENIERVDNFVECPDS